MEIVKMELLFPQEKLERIFLKVQVGCLKEGGDYTRTFPIELQVEVILLDVITITS